MTTNTRFLKVEMGWERPGDVMAPFREAEKAGEFGNTDAVAYTEQGQSVEPYVSEHLWPWLQRRFGRSIIRVSTVDQVPANAKWIHRPKV